MHLDTSRIKKLHTSHISVQSPSSFLAMVFEKESAAKYQANRYKYNNARVKKITPAMCNIEYFEDNYDR